MNLKLINDLDPILSGLELEASLERQAIETSNELNLFINQIESELKEYSELADTIDQIKSTSKLITEKGLSDGLMVMLNKGMESIELQLPELNKTNSKEIIDICTESFGSSVKKAYVAMKDIIMRIISFIKTIWIKYLGWNVIKLRKLQNIQANKLTDSKDFDVDKWSRLMLRGYFYSKDEKDNDTNTGWTNIIGDVEGLQKLLDELVKDEDISDIQRAYEYVGLKLSNNYVLKDDPSFKQPNLSIRMTPMTTGWTRERVVKCTKDIIAVLSKQRGILISVNSVESKLKAIINQSDNEVALKHAKDRLRVMSKVSSTIIHYSSKLAVQMINYGTRLPINES